MTPPRTRLLAPSLLLLALLAWGLTRVGWVEELDRSALLALRSSPDPALPLGPPWMEGAVRDLTALGGHLLLGLGALLAATWLALTGRRAEGATVLVASLGAMVLSDALKDLAARPRPDLVPHGHRVFSPSFPSGHALISAATWLTIGAVVARDAPTRAAGVLLTATAALLVLLIGLSRLYLGVHWPSDVLAGWCVGGAWAALCLAALRRCSAARGETKARR